ncbi:MAG: PrsW family intramembrane metalloprotease [Dehalococcoidia bacterium]|nr:PrsW family intramembrane metalloprotease [Dehalococcoidia bacterium]
MSVPAILISALAPGIFWLWFFLRGRSYRPNPRRLVAGTFFLGMVSVIPAGLIEFVLAPDVPDDIGASVGAAAGVMFLVVGPVEELSKFFAVRLWAAKSLHFDEPLDGLVFAAAASLGFATAENVFYALQYGPEVMVVRGPLSTVAHVVFGSFWGVALARAHLAPKRRDIIITGLLFAAGAHGVFNFAIVTGYWWVSVLLVVFGAFRVSRLFVWGRQVSPFRLRRNVPVLACPRCDNPYRLGAKFCGSCGVITQGTTGEITCSRCAVVNRPVASYCSSCGDRFVPLR